MESRRRAQRDFDDGAEIEMFIKCGKYKVYYEIEKRADKKTFVFLHGLGGDLSVWNFLKEPVVKAGCSFLSIDLPGHGFSSRLVKPIAMPEFASVIKKILEREKIKHPILAGHCFGGMTALEFVLRYPQYPDKLILICSSYKLPNWLKYSEILLKVFKSVKIGPEFEHADFDKFLGTKDIDFKRLYSDIVHIGLKSYLNIFQGTRNWNRERELKNIKTPVLVIGGENDKIIPLSGQKKLTEKLVHGKLKIIKTNHIAPINAKNKLEEIILDELAENGQMK